MKETLSLAGFLQPSVLSLKGCMHQFTHDTASLVAERLSARLLTLQSVFSVGGVWPQLLSHFRNAICDASGMQARVWLVCKHPSHLGMQLKVPVYQTCVHLYVSLSFPALWRH